MVGRTLMVFGEKNFNITIPTDAKVTFGPWAPPNARGYVSESSVVGTLRIYKKTKDNIIACYAGVTGFQELGMGYSLSDECTDPEVQHDLLKAGGHVFCWKCGSMLQEKSAKRKK